MTEKGHLFSFFFEDPRKIENLMRNRTKIVFHCEFSMMRGPKMYYLMRDTDRKINLEKWPMLFYPEIYLLEGGYKNFHSQYSVSHLTISTCVREDT